jgi:hypothetical protein
VKSEEITLIKKVDAWSILDNVFKEKWNISNLEEVLGKPNEISSTPGNNLKSYLYYDNLTFKGETIRYQSWAFDIDQNNQVSGLYYNPHPRIFMNEIRKRWANLKCFEKIEPSKIPHIIKKQRFLSCENGKFKAYYSNYEEVDSILMSK